MPLPRLCCPRRFQKRLPHSAVKEYPSASPWEKICMAFRLFVVMFCAVAVLPQSPQLTHEVKAFVKYDQPTIVLTHVRVVDGTGAAARDDQSIVISQGKIQSIMPAASMQIPAGANVLDSTGHTVIPGLIGMHDHMYYPAPKLNGREALYPEHASSFPRLYLAGGVTTIRTTGSVEPYSDLETKKAIDAGKVPGPKMHVTGPYLEGAGSFTPQMHQIKDAGDARKTVEYWADQGVDNYKAYMHITRAELGAAIKAAHKRGLKVTGHLCSVTFREAAALGIDDLEHGIVVDTEFDPAKKPDECPPVPGSRAVLEKLDIESAPVQEMIRDLVAHHVAMTSTLPVFETFVPNRAPKDARILDAMMPEAKADYLAATARASEAGDKSPWNALFQKEMQFERDFVKAGGLLLAGLDPTGIGGVIAGFGDQREVELLVEAGFTPLEAIKIATYNGAQYLGELDRIGSLAPGKQADIVLLKGNPAAQIKDIENVEIVFKDGIGYDSAKLIEATKGMVGVR
jgi:imidazolonepropionase-like amidohydrolase